MLRVVAFCHDLILYWAFLNSLGASVSVSANTGALKQSHCKTQSTDKHFPFYSHGAMSELLCHRTQWTCLLMLLFGALLILLSLHFAIMETLPCWKKSATLHLKYISYTSFDWCVWVFVCALVYLLFQDIISVFISLYSILVHLWMCNEKGPKRCILLEMWDNQHSVLIRSQCKLFECPCITTKATICNSTDTKTA